MSNWDLNQFYPFNQADKTALPIVTTLLKAYTVTAGCLETLGKRLEQKLEFGFFTSGTEIIKEGESGRDIFLLCSGSMDVLVNNQVVVQMEAPKLVGEKAIISADSKRAATIRIATETQALVVKIPMDPFVRNFNDRNISDIQFTQERSIFQNIFQGIQERLFEYVFLQKILWEEASATLNLINQQLLAKKIDNQQNPGWSDTSWNIVQKHLRATLNFTWPSKIPLNETTFRSVTLRYLHLKYGKKNKNEAVIKIKQEWRKILLGVCERILKNTPEEKKIIPMPELNLFNPIIYRMRLVSLLKKLEKKFQRQIATINEKDVRKPDAFFGTGNSRNVFNVINYLTYFNENIKVPNSRRIQAQIGQKVASVAAECENQFNDSVMKMQKFLNDVKRKKLITNGNENEKEFEFKNNEALALISTLYKGLAIYQNNATMTFSNQLGHVKFNAVTHPTFVDFLPKIRVPNLKAKIQQHFSKLCKISDFQKDSLSMESLQYLFHLVSFEKGDTLTLDQFKDLHWFPMTDDVYITYNEERYLELKPGMIFNCDHWSEFDDVDPTKITMASQAETLLLALPTGELPWKNMFEPTRQVMVDEQLPLMQWLYDKLCDLFKFLLEKRNHYYDECTKIHRVIDLSQKIDHFEQKQLRLPKVERMQLINWLNRTLGMKVTDEQASVSSSLAKQIYNFILKNVSAKESGLSMEECGNVAYTRWRKLLFEVVGQLPSLNKVVTKSDHKEAIQFYDILSKEITPILSPALGKNWELHNPFIDNDTQMDFSKLLHPDIHKSTEASTRVFESIIEVMSQQIQNVFLDIKESDTYLKTLRLEHSQEEMYASTDNQNINVINESVKLLENVLGGDKLLN